MAISEFEKFKVEKSAKAFCASRNKNYPPEQLYIDYRLEDQSLYIFEVRPQWDNPENKMEILVAKISYIKKQKIWKLYWLRQNMKWHLYEGGVNMDLDFLLTEIWNDEYGCFWG